MWNKIKDFFTNEENYWIMFMNAFMTLVMMIVVMFCMSSLMVLPVAAFVASLGAMIMVELKDKAWGAKFNFSNLIAGILPSLFFIVLFAILLFIF